MVIKRSRLLGLDNIILLYLQRAKAKEILTVKKANLKLVVSNPELSIAPSEKRANLRLVVDNTKAKRFNVVPRFERATKAEIDSELDRLISIFSSKNKQIG